MKHQLKKLLTLALSAALLLPLGACTTPSEPAETEADTPATVEQTEPATTAAPETEPVVETPPYDPDFRVTAYVVGGITDLSTFDTDHLARVTDLIMIGDGMPTFDNQGGVLIDPNFGLYVENIKKACEGLPIRIHVNLFGPGAEKPIEEYADESAWRTDIARQHQKAFKSGKLEGNIKNLLETYGLDGVFFDWEYPILDSHRKWMGDFLISLDATLGDDYVIGNAVHPTYAWFSAKALAVIDMVELMCYDVFDDQGYHATMEHAKDFVQSLLDLGYDPKQIDLGIPFYGHATNGQMTWSLYGGLYDKLDENGIFYSEHSGLSYSLNTPDMVYEKTAWCIEQGIGGVMSWHYSCDAPSDSGYSLFEAIQRAKDDAGVK